MFKLEPLSGTEAITRNQNPIILAGGVNKFWGWCYSSLANPFIRGFFAEYLIYQAIADNKARGLIIDPDYLMTKLEGDVEDIIFYYAENKYMIQVKSMNSLKKNSIFNRVTSAGYDPVNDANIPD